MEAVSRRRFTVGLGALAGALAGGLLGLGVRAVRQVILDRKRQAALAVVTDAGGARA